MGPPTVVDGEAPLPRMVLGDSDPSMGPPTVVDGEGQPRSPLLPHSGSFNGAADCRRRREVTAAYPQVPFKGLQWGRRLSSTESNEELTRRIGHLDLQWGRRLSSTESVIVTPAPVNY